MNCKACRESNTRKRYFRLLEIHVGSFENRLPTIPLPHALVFSSFLVSLLRSGGYNSSPTTENATLSQIITTLSINPASFPSSTRH